MMLMMSEHPMELESKNPYQRVKFQSRESLIAPYLELYEEIDAVVRAGLSHVLGYLYDEERAYLIQRPDRVRANQDRIIEFIASDGYPYYVCTLGDLLPFL